MFVIIIGNRVGPVCASVSLYLYSR